MIEYIVTWENTAGGPVSSHTWATSPEAAIWRVALLLSSPTDIGHGFAQKFISVVPSGATVEV